MEKSGIRVGLRRAGAPEEEDGGMLPGGQDWEGLEQVHRDRDRERSLLQPCPGPPPPPSHSQLVAAVHQPPPPTPPPRPPPALNGILTLSTHLTFPCRVFLFPLSPKQPSIPWN